MCIRDRLFVTSDDCEFSDSLNVRVEDGIVITDFDFFEPTNPDSLFTGCQIEVSPIISNPDQLQITDYQWFINETFISSDDILTNTIEETTDELTISLIISTENCQSTFIAQRPLFSNSEVTIPNIFSPNDDGRNDYFRPIMSPKAEVTNMRIFNRWGQLVYDNETNDRGWDGKSLETDQPVEVYIYQISVRLPGGRELPPMTGDVTLIR